MTVIDLSDPVAIKAATGSKVVPAIKRPDDKHPLRKVRRPLSVVTPLLEGPDVYALQEAENDLFSKTGLHDHVSLDGEFGELSAKATNHAGWLLGLEPQGEDPHWIGKLFTQDEQTLIRNPDKRSPAQKKRGQDRVREAKERQAQNDHSSATPSGQRALIKEYCEWGVAHKDMLHYTQVRPMDNLNDLLRLPDDDDCSEFFTKSYKYAKLPDPNGPAFNYNGYGYTGTQYANAKKIMSVDAKVGDGVEWGGTPGSHIVIYAGGGMCWSMGQEAGPLYISIAAEIQAHAGQSTNYLKFIND